MQLNEIIEENSLATISKRTRISVENIEKLVNRDFSLMKRVKALGFISILEREFNIELEGLKQECASFFSTYPEEAFDAKLVVTIPESDDRSGGWLAKLLMLLVLFGLGYGAWYFVNNDNTMRAESTEVVEDDGTGFIGSIVNQAKAWLGDSTVLGGDTPVANDAVWAKEEGEQNQTRNTNDDEATPLPETATEEQIIKKVKQEQQEILNQEAEAEMANSDNIEAEDALAVAVPSMSDAGTQGETAKLEEVRVTPKKSNAKSKPKTTPKKRVVNKGKNIVTLLPTKKVWVGYTDLSTMKRAAKMMEDAVDFDTSKSSWILVAGHNSINFIVEGEVVAPSERDKNYFLLKKGKIQEIDKETFQKLNKSTVW